jgi:hypothetical protein
MVPMVGRAMVYVVKVRWKVMRILSKIYLSRIFWREELKTDSIRILVLDVFICIYYHIHPTLVGFVFHCPAVQPASK